MLTSDDFILDVAPKNGRPQRVVQIEHRHGRSIRENIDTNSSQSRKRLIRRCAERFGGSSSDYVWLDTALVEQADQADARADQEAAGFGDHAPIESQTSQLMHLAEGIELFHDPNGDAYGRLEVEGHLEVHRLDGRAFREWMAHEFWKEHGKVPSGGTLTDALNTLKGIARFEGGEREIHIRCAQHKGAIYYDLADRSWRAVQVTPAGWEIREQPPVMFRRPHAMGPLYVPERSGALDELRNFINISDGDWPLLLGWLIAAFWPHGPYSILVVHGKQGSAKSTLCRMLKAIVDPNEAPLRSEPRDERDLSITAQNSWVLVYDNISKVPNWLSDGFCRLSTGGGYCTRKLYENDEETIFNLQRPGILNGITEVATRDDLLERSLLISLPRIGLKVRQPEKMLWEEFNRKAPRILGALLSAVSATLENLPRINVSDLPRMADFAKLAIAAEPALGLKPGEFMEAYRSNQDSGADLALEDSPISKPLFDLMESRPTDEGKAIWSGTATELLRALEEQIDDKTTRLKSWPKTPRNLSADLKRLVPNLAKRGIEVQFGRSPKPRRAPRVRAVSNREGALLYIAVFIFQFISLLLVLMFDFQVAYPAIYHIETH